MIMSSSMDSSLGGSQLPPGYRFHPTDEELVVHYLKKKIASAPLPVAIIAEVDLYKFDPWELPAKASFGEHEWYFFSPRDRKYPNGARPNRAATSGYWKATGTDKPILTPGGTQKIAVKKALVFYRGKPPKGIKTNWIMHEYRLIHNNNNNNNNGVMQPPGVKKNSARLDNWVLCRIYKKNNSQRPPMEFEKQAPVPMDGSPSTMGHRRHNLEIIMQVETKQASNCGLFLDNNNDPFFEGLLSDNPEAATTTTTSVTLQSDPNYWNEATGGDSSTSTSTTKNVCVLANNSTSVANLSNSGFHHQVLLGSLGDGVYSQHYQVSGINWSS